jgi:hypothetical protein
VVIQARHSGDACVPHHLKLYGGKNTGAERKPYAFQLYLIGFEAPHLRNSSGTRFPT